MDYVVVTIDFPEADADQRNKIYEALRKLNWVKVNEFGSNISTVWRGNWGTPAGGGGKSSSIDEFCRCTWPYGKLKVVAHLGPNWPTSHQKA